MSAVATAPARPRPAGAARSRPKTALASLRVAEPVDLPGVRYRWALDPWPGRLAGFPLWEARPGPGRLPAFEGRALSSDLLARLARRDLSEVADGEAVVIGAAADPWPADEARVGRTRRILEALLDLEGLDLAIVTRSDGIARDAERLARLAERHALSVKVAIPTTDRRLAAAIEPGAPRPDLRLKAMSELAAAGVPVGLRIAPVLPDVTDDPGGLDALASAAAGAGARSLEAEPLVLAPSAVRAAFPALERAFPDLVDHARERWEASAALPAEYRSGLDDLVERLRRKHGLNRDRGAGAPARGPQLDLF